MRHYFEGKLFAIQCDAAYGCEAIIPAEPTHARGGWMTHGWSDKFGGTHEIDCCPACATKLAAAGTHLLAIK